MELSDQDEAAMSGGEGAEETEPGLGIGSGSGLDRVFEKRVPLGLGLGLR